MSIKTGLLACLIMLCGSLASVFAAELPGLALVDERGRAVGNVAVVVENAQLDQPGKSPPMAIMDQMDLKFVPKVLVIQPGTKVHFPNSDATRHHVYSFSKAKSFELQLYQGESPPVLFDTPGLVVLGCNIHDSMRGYIYVVQSPVHGVTDSSGELELPAFESSGKPTLRLWHPLMDQPLKLNTDSLSADGRDRTEISLPITLPEPLPEPEESSLRNRLQEYGSDDD